MQFYTIKLECYSVVTVTVQKQSGLSSMHMIDSIPEKQLVRGVVSIYATVAVASVKNFAVNSYGCVIIYVEAHGCTQQCLYNYMKAEW